MRSCCIIGYGRAGKIQERAIRGVFDLVCIVDKRLSVGESLHEYATSFDSDAHRAISRQDVDLIIITTPTATHYELCRVALEGGKHVFVEKPLATCTQDCEALYALARSKNRLLYTAFNRRHDPEWRELGRRLDVDYPLFANVICRDCPFPPAAYLASCGSIFRDCAVHDLDMLCILLNDTPVEVLAHVDDAGETASTSLTFSRGCVARLIHSRHSPYYDQFVTLFCRKQAIDFGRKTAPIGTSFDERYADSYVRQMHDVSRRLSEQSHEPNVSLDHMCFLERLVGACEQSANDGAPVSLKTMRAYSAAKTRVYHVYRQARAFHTPDTVRRMCKRYHPGQFGTLTVWEVLGKLADFIDVSDPDVDVPNMQHALQTAESIRMAGHPPWMQLIGLIHDFGKVLYCWGHDDDGTSIDTQWSLVGDTFIVGCAVPDCMVYPELSQESGHGEIGTYERGCGLDACLVSFGHDEYLYRVLRASSTKLPEAAFRIVRYHSLYAWHQGGAYTALENEEDKAYKGWVTLFNTHDLYSKKNAPVSVQDVKEYYSTLAAEFLPHGLCF